jgi:2-succinyl-5-enolpyruvyl-6-hydroxy-3-cyclohexene-1-carboxylate synthase
MSAPPRNVAFEWARVLFRSLVQAGVKDAVLSPGSRSTPFVLAAIQTPGLRCHDVIDERSAAFFALGLAKVSGVAPILVCTSGTAGAHYAPAIIEAARSRTPLLALTADRPFELQHCEASQTVDQVKLFGSHARLYLELGAPEDAAASLRWLRHAATRAVLATRWPEPGPVHINARARKPLEPPDTLDDSERALALRAEAVTTTAVSAFAPHPSPDAAGLDVVAKACLSARHGLIVCGPGPLSQAVARPHLEALAQATGFPVLPEAASQFRFASFDGLRCDAFDTLCRSPGFRSTHRPDVVIQVGAPPTSASWERFLGDAGPKRYVLSEGAWSDPQSEATAFILGELSETLRGVSMRLTSRRPSPEPTAWGERWRSANGRAWQAVRDALAGPFHEGTAVRQVLRHVPRGSLLAVGNSLPIREIDTFCPADAATCDVWSQRGASGIDGLVSGAAGAASTGRTTTLLLGDVSFLHDLGGLAAAQHATVPLPVVVLNNGGGRLFEQLPLGKSAAGADQMQHWVTPHGLSLSRAGLLYDVPAVQVSNHPALDEALATAYARRGCSLIEVRVPPDSSAAAYCAIDTALSNTEGQP